MSDPSSPPQEAPTGRSLLHAVRLRSYGVLARLRRQTSVGRPAPGDVVPLEEGAKAPVPRWRYNPASWGLWGSFVALVALPALVSILYLAFLASDQYVAEARFAVRTMTMEVGRDLLKNSTTASNTPSSAAATAANPFALAGQDAYIVAAYARSNAVLVDLAPQLNVREIFSRPEADFWARLPSGASDEKLSDYWRSMVSSTADNMSGIITVTARAFRRDDALNLAQGILEASEKLVNTLSARARADALKRAEEEARRAQAGVTQMLEEMQALRDAEGLISPLAQANSSSILLLQLSAERIRLQSEKTAGLRSLAPTAPTIVALSSRIDAVDKEIEKLKGQLTSSRQTAQGKPLSATLVRFEEMEVKRQFAEKLYGMAQDALERARQKVEQQSLYVTVFVPPALPQEARYPERMLMSLLIPLVLLVIWGIFALTAATVADHSY